MNARDELLRATGEAARLVDRFPAGERSSFDIIRTLQSLGIPVLCRPLDNLLGATVTVGDAARGVLVTTKLPLTVQRFTLAHELGHLLLGHRLQFDETMGQAGRVGAENRPIEERAADTFASELLAPRVLIRSSAKRQGWKKRDLQTPEVIYQLGLRLGLSFKATCWALAGQDLLPTSTAHRFANQGGIVKDVKARLSPIGPLGNSWADVWVLAEGDTGLHLEAGPDDLFVVQVDENVSAGYVWELGEDPAGTRTTIDGAEMGERYGAPTQRTMCLQYEGRGRHTVELLHRRPWNGEAIGGVRFSIDNWGKEGPGIPRQMRTAVLAGGTA